MTSKLKCPFCGKKLYSSDSVVFTLCEKRWKPIIELKQALTQAKQDLEKAKAGFLNIRSWCGVSGLSGYVPTICEQQIKAIEERIKND